MDKKAAGCRRRRRAARTTRRSRKSCWRSQTDPKGSTWRRKLLQRCDGWSACVEAASPASKEDMQLVSELYDATVSRPHLPGEDVGQQGFAARPPLDLGLDACALGDAEGALVHPRFASGPPQYRTPHVATASKGEPFLIRRAVISPISPMQRRASAGSMKMHGMRTPSPQGSKRLVAAPDSCRWPATDSVSARL